MQRCVKLDNTRSLVGMRPQAAMHRQPSSCPRRYQCSLPCRLGTQQHQRRCGRLVVLSSRQANPQTEQRAPQQASSSRRLLSFGGARRKSAAPDRQRVENNIAPLPRSRKWRKQTDQPGDGKQPAATAMQPSKRSVTAGPLTDFASAVDPKPKAAAMQQDPQPGSSTADKRQLAAAVRTSAQKLATRQPAERPSGPQVQVLPKAEAEVLQEPPLARLARLYSRPAALVFASSHMLATACAVTGVAATPPWMPPIVGAAVGGLFAALNRFGVVRFWRAPTAPLRVVITGSTKGIGKALAREFLRAGDSVVVTARSMHGVRTTVRELQAEMGPGICIKGFDVDVSSPGSIARLASLAKNHLGGVDVWVNNAGYSGSFQSLVDAKPEQIVEVVTTNLLGSLLATRAAIRLMGGQETAGHIFNVDGAGADGTPTPQYAAYGATKSGIAHMMGSLKAELQAAGSSVSVHTISPGMVLTGLLLSGATTQNKQVFNILCEQPETVAAYLVPRMRTIVARNNNAQYIKYLTPLRALWFFLNAPFRVRRFFDAEGERLYADEFDRMFGRHARRTKRLAEAAARRTSTLGLVYSLSMSASFLLIVMYGTWHPLSGQ